MAFAECFLSYTVTVGENHSKSLILQLGERSELSEFGTFSFHETFLVNLNHCGSQWLKITQKVSFYSFASKASFCLSLRTFKFHETFLVNLNHCAVVHFLAGRSVKKECYHHS